MPFSDGVGARLAVAVLADDDGTDVECDAADLILALANSDSVRLDEYVLVAVFWGCS